MLWLLITVSFFLYALYSMLYFISESNKTNINGPPCLPIVGNGYYFLGSSSKFLGVIQKVKERYGDPLRAFLLSDRYIVLTKPKHVEVILSNTDYISKADSYKHLHKWLGQGLLTSTDSKWKAHRKLLTPAFHFNILQTFLPIFLKNQKILIQKLSLVADGKPVNLFPIMALAALDNITEAAMGVSVNALRDVESEYVSAIDKISKITIKRVFNPLIGIDFIFNLLPIKKTYDDALEIVHSKSRRVIEVRNNQLQLMNVTLASYDYESGIKKKNAFLDLLLLSEINGQRLDIKSVQEEVDTFMFEGHDTTTSALCFTLYCIATNEGVSEKILEEQRSIFGDLNTEPTYRDLQQMKYLEQVIKESLRLYPSVPLIGRVAPTNIDIDGYVVPKGWNIVLDVFNMQRRAEYFPDPLKFKPERFASDNNSHLVYSWVAFSAGPRNCIGQKFAMMEMKVVVSSIVKNFQILPTGIEPILASDLILRSKNGVLVKLLPRRK